MARRDASGRTQGRILSTRGQAGLWTEARQTSPQSDPDWKKLGVSWANLRAGPPSSREPDWSPHGVQSHLRYRRCYILHGLAASDQSLEHPGLVSCSATNSTCYPEHGNLIPMLPFSVTLALPICPSPLIKC